eukprot:Tbor_TRINITY_DN5886_c4_g6::TRINITY_DN5886_c4_g6_i1::g.6916::m.6916
MSTKPSGTSSAGRGPKVDLSQYKLIFPLPITSVIQNIVKMSNRENTIISYKLKTNTKGRYVVHPNSGFLHPKEEVILKFTLDPKALRGEILDENTDDWFLFETRYVTPEDDCSSITNYWHPVGGGRPHGLASRMRLTCVYTKVVPKEMAVRMPSGNRESSSRVTPSHSTQSNQSIPQSMAPDHSSPVSSMPLAKQQAKSPNPPNLDFVADEFKHEVNGKSNSTKVLLIKFLTFPVPLPVVLILLMCSFICAIGEDPSSPFMRLILYMFGSTVTSTEVQTLCDVGQTDAGNEL